MESTKTQFLYGEELSKAFATLDREIVKEVIAKGKELLKITDCEQFKTAL